MMEPNSAGTPTVRRECCHGTAQVISDMAVMRSVACSRLHRVDRHSVSAICRPLSSRIQWRLLVPCSS